MIFKDQLNRTVTLIDEPKRIISLVPSQTELLIDLGLKECIVGITKFCVHPRDLRKEIAVVGGIKTVQYDKITELNPNLIICNKEENTLAMVQELEKIAPVWVSDITSFEESLDMITRLGDLFQVSKKASEIVKSITSEKNTFRLLMETRSVKKVAYLIWKNPYMAAGSDTFIHSLLKLNNFQNIILEKRYPEVTMKQLKKADVVLLSSEPYPFKEADMKELMESLNVDVITVDGEFFSWDGSRLKVAFRYFETLHNR
ncbi:MAG: ABC transporter substrate-binding protein [Flavobacteriaceae bacterium]|nr:ABC transporter substrate-binding protein [Flavobacteriaceae bacterium]